MKSHSLTRVPWKQVSLVERVALEATTAVLWSLQSDERIAVLINILAAELRDSVDKDQVDAVIEMLRFQLKDEQEH